MPGAVVISVILESVQQVFERAMPKRCTAHVENQILTMYIVAIAWLYVTLMMAVTEKSITAGVLTFVFYGLLPCALLVWLIGTPARRRARSAAQIQNEGDENDKIDDPSVAGEHANAPDRADTKRD
jgi:biotin transporter BioY